MTTEDGESRAAESHKVIMPTFVGTSLPQDRAVTSLAEGFFNMGIQKGENASGR